METYKVLDLVYTPEEGQECFSGTSQECIDFINEQGGATFMYKIVPIVQKKTKIKVGDTVQFKDKTGEILTGEVTEVECKGLPNGTITVLCFKKSWDKNVSCLVYEKSVKLIKGVES